MRMGVGPLGCSLDVGATSDGFDLRKVRRVTVIGGAKMAVYNDLSPEDPVRGGRAVRIDASEPGFDRASELVEVI